jgi:hypothetical protein
VGVARSPKSTPERTPRTNPPRRGEDDESICTRDHQIIIDVVAVDDPFVASKEDTLLFQHLPLGHTDPTGIPTIEIKMDDGQASLSREQPCECTLSSASHASDDNAVANQVRCNKLAHRSQFG